MLLLSARVVWQDVGFRVQGFRVLEVFAWVLSRGFFEKGAEGFGGLMWIS